MSDLYVDEFWPKEKKNKGWLWVYWLAASSHTRMMEPNKDGGPHATTQAKTFAIRMRVRQKKKRKYTIAPFWWQIPPRTTSKVQNIDTSCIHGRTSSTLIRNTTARWTWLLRGTEDDTRADDDTDWHRPSIRLPLHSTFSYTTWRQCIPLRITYDTHPAILVHESMFRSQYCRYPIPRWLIRWKASAGRLRLCSWGNISANIYASVP